MSITRAEVEHVARLARLELTEDELEQFREQLSAVLDRATRIQSLPLDDLPPTAHPVDLRNVWREDVVVPPLPSGEIVAAAPESEAGLYRVPRILEDSE